MKKKTLWLSGMLALALAPWTEAMADGYWIRLKDANGSLVPGVTGGFSYNKPAIPIQNQGDCAAGNVVVVNVLVPANALGQGVPQLQFNTNVVAQKPLICRTHSWKEISGKEWPAGTKQCLDNGTNVAGVSGSLKTKSGQYTLTFHSTDADVLDKNGCGDNNDNNPPITLMPANSFEPSYNRTFTITGPNGFTYSGNYWVVNQVHANPEPGTLPLLMISMSAMGLLAWKRKRDARLAS
jgi:hypothetical protein